MSIRASTFTRLVSGGASPSGGRPRRTITPAGPSGQRGGAHPAQLVEVAEHLRVEILRQGRVDAQLVAERAAEAAQHGNRAGADLPGIAASAGGGVGSLAEERAYQIPARDKAH